nr:MBL fold metallo-hydrolase [uncultured Pseudodesulfovibrio sp.]
MKKFCLIILTTATLLSVVVGLAAYAAMGQSPAEDQRSMYRSSDNYRDEMFINAMPVSLKMDSNMLATTVRFFMTSNRPPQPLTVHPITASDFNTSPADLQVVWLGHSSTILDIDGVRLLVDPVFDNASPVPFTVRRFQNAPIKRDELPEIHAVVISHDHYDHLEMKTIKALIAKTPLFIVPLGVSAHLIKWGCPADKIIELDWWESHTVNGVDVVATPTRHFSGRTLGTRNKTQWASFVFKGPRHRAFYSGDGGYDDRFKKIGERFGPFDLTMMESGAWNKDWPDVHMFPDESVKAHIELGGKHMLPVHWGAYDLAFHKWDDPIRKVTEHAATHGVALLTPRMGEKCIPGESRHEAWWEPQNLAQNTHD